MVDKCEIKVPKSRKYITEWPFVRWPYVRVAFSPDPVQCCISGALRHEDNVRWYWPIERRRCSNARFGRRF